MSLVVVGSIAFDAVKTPFGRRDRMLGGSAVHFSLAASFLCDDVRVVGPVGADFGPEEYAVLHERGINTDDIERHEDGRTFFWRGHYEYDMSTAFTEDTQLNVFGEFQPKLSPETRDSSHLFLGNIQPDLQREVRELCTGTRLAGLDSMNLWIQTTRESLLRTIEQVDIVFLNDAEVRMLTHPNLVRGARQIMAMGPRAVVVKRGEYGAALFTQDGFFALPGYPLEEVTDPTGAGDSFAGGFMGYIANLGDDVALDDPHLRRAMTYGTVLASFNVEEFGTERMRGLTRDEIEDRFAELKAMTHFEALPYIQPAAG